MRPWAQKTAIAKGARKLDRKQTWTWTAALLLCVVLLALNIAQRRRLSDLEQAVWNAQNGVMDEVSRLEGQIASLRSDLENADHLVLDWSYTSALNREKRGLDVDVTVRLKEWTEDAALELLWTSPGSRDSKGGLPMVYDGAGSFTGKLEIPLDGFREILLDAAVQNGGTRRQERLGSLGDAAALLPIQCEAYGISGPEYEQGKDGGGVFTISNFHTGVCGSFEKVPKTMDHAFRLLRNGKLADELAAEPADAQGGYFGNGELTSECRKGDVLTWTFFCRDESGVGYAFFLEEWSVGEDGLVQNAPGLEWPKLTWD